MSETTRPEGGETTGSAGDEDRRAASAPPRLELALLRLDRPELPLEALFRFAAEQGLDAIDLYTRINLHPHELQTAATLSREYGVRINAVSSRSMPIAASCDPQAEVALALEALELAARLGARYTVGTTGSAEAALPRAAAIDRYLDRMRPVFARAELLEVSIAVENVFDRDGGREITSTVDGALELMRAGAPRLGLCWNTANFVVAEGPQRTAGQTLDALLPWLMLVQLKDVAEVDADPRYEQRRLLRDARSGDWQPRPLGDGVADPGGAVDELLRRGWTGTLSLEMFTSGEAAFERYWADSMRWLAGRATPPR